MSQDCVPSFQMQNVSTASSPYPLRNLRVADFQHSVPKTRLAVAQRINLTFRQIKPKGPLRA
jgi:hypothetical protein